MTPTLFDEAGKPIRLSTRVGKGGEGEVYLIDGSDRVVKFYTLKDLASREQKVRQMVSLGLADRFQLVAFPKSIVSDKAGRFVGFTMAKVESHKPLHELYSPGARKAHFPQADYRFLVLAAANIARAIGSANASGCIVGDINHSGILISRTGTVTLIDADSFQIRSGDSLLYCVVGVPEYTPPELQSKTLKNIVRTENHDAFGLAVAIFLLLFMGRHPFSGRYSGGDMPLERAIGEFRFAYSTKRSVGMSPPPGVPTLRDFPTEIGEAFEAAFSPNGINGRPSPRQWMGLLDSLKDNLRRCSDNTLHYYPQGASDCPWCRMERRFFVPLFLPVITATDLGIQQQPVIGDIAVIWRAIESVRPPTNKPFPQYAGPKLGPSSEVSAAASARKLKQFIGWSLVVVTIGIVVWSPSLVFLSLIAGALAWGLINSGAGSTSEFENAYKAVQTRIYEAEAEWNYFNSGADFQRVKAELIARKTEYDGLSRTLREKLDSYSRNRREVQLTRFLDSHLIRNYKIPKIGTGRRAVLLSYGIETAADLLDSKVLAVPGFGPKTAQPLFNWRRHLESRFAFNPAETQADKMAVGNIHGEIAKRSAQLKAELGMGPAKLTQLAAAIPSKQSANLGFIDMLLKQQAQAVANLEALGVALPHVDRPPAKSWPSVSATSQPATSPTIQVQPSPSRCPKCGGGMVIRLATRGANRGGKFYGCTRFPACNGTRNYP